MAKPTLQSLQMELEEARQQIHQARARWEHDVHFLRTRCAALATTTRALQIRVDALEAERRDRETRAAISRISTWRASMRDTFALIFRGRA